MVLGLKLRRRAMVGAAAVSLAVLLAGARFGGGVALADAPPVPISTASEQEPQIFRFVPASGQNPRHVFVAGDFNGWSTDATPMHRHGSAYTVKVPLTPGIHHYKFVVDGNWLNDPEAPKNLQEDDGSGGVNSGVLVGLGGDELARPAPNTVKAAAVSFEPSDAVNCNVVAADSLRLSFRAQAGNVTSASVLYQTSDAPGWQSVAMDKEATAAGMDRYGQLLQLPAGAGSHLRYVLELHAGTGSAFVAGGKAYASASAAQADAYAVDLTPTFTTPDWARHAIWYQIFPERFRNGDTANDPPHTARWTSNWFDLQPGEHGEFYRNIYNRRYGGDMQGILQELPYLRSLGVNAIYLNPVFQAESLHKYDASDYRHIDEHFGFAGDIEQLHGETQDPATWQWTRSDKLFLDLVAEAHRQGFRVIVDGVFNHVGRKFWAFQDVMKNGKDSKYADWFDITDWNPTTAKDGKSIPFSYRAWDGINGSLPIFRKDAKLGIVHGPREHILAIAKRWLAPDGDASRGVDGFRLDAPENVPHPFWVDFRKTVKEAKPDAYIDGEIWSWAQAWLSGDQFDAVMNYQFAIPAQQFFVDQKKAISPSKFNAALAADVFNYPLQAALVNQNLLDSHDTDRAGSMMVNPDLGYESRARMQENPSYRPRKPNAVERARLMQEVALQMTFLGAPMIYYGDEVGMWGASDPSDRQPMIWKDLGAFDEADMRFDQGQFDWYQRLIAIRRQLPALQTGFFHPVEIDDAHGVYCFARTLGKQEVFVAINHSKEPQRVTMRVDAGGSDQKWVNWLDTSEADVHAAADAPDGRPTVAARGDAPLHLHDGHVRLQLPAWGSAVISTADAAALAVKPGASTAN
jgi:cyclomaltodextrinase